MSDATSGRGLSRRHFLAGTSGAVAAAAATSILAGEKSVPEAFASERPVREPLRIGADPLALENDAMRVEIDRSSGLFRLIDKAAGETWEPDPWLGTPGVITLEKPGGGRREIALRDADVSIARNAKGTVEIAFWRFRLPGQEGTIDGRLATRLSLQGAKGPLKVEIVEFTLPEDWKLIDLEYPCRLGALRTDVDDGYMIVPYLQGCIVPSTIKNWKRLPEYKLWAWEDGPCMEPGGADLRIYGWHVLSLPMYGLVKRKSTLSAIIETENDASLRLVLNSTSQQAYSRTGRYSPYPRVAATSPLWLSEKKQLGYPRSMLYEFLPDGGYVGAAKHYRCYARKQGLVVTLREKIERTPQLDQIIGGPWVNLGGGYPYYIDHPLYRYTWNDAKQFVDDLTDYVGAKRALLTLWIGYQNLPPDNWPFHPAQGTLDELRSLVKYARERNVLINFYHGLPTLMEDAPNGDVARARRSDPQGNMTQRWGRHCPAFFLEYAKKNLPNVLRDSGIVCDYEDIFTATALGECWDPAHPLTRRQDRKIREETLKYINSLGVFSGSEWPTGYSMPYLCYFRNGTAGAGSHIILNQFPVPLLNMVFKDCALMYGTFFPTPGAEMMRDIAAGCHFQITLESIHHYYGQGFRETRHGAKSSVALFHDWLRTTGPAELLSHEYLDNINGPYRTRFSDGSEALANPTSHSFDADGQKLPPESIVLKLPDGRRIQAAPKTGWDVETS